MKTTVVLAAYNGEKFILEQLESIRTQTVPVNEVIILDDCSTDNTPKICEEYIGKYELCNWFFLKNHQNVGFKQNFYSGFQKASGDIIFICDQDDIWLPNRVEKTLDFFNQHVDVLSMCCGFSIMKNNRIICEHVKIPNRKKNANKKISFREFCDFYSYLGMTTAFRKKLLDLNYFESFSVLPYDVAVNFVAMINCGLYYVDEVLVIRRTHYSESARVAEDWARRDFNGNRRLYQIFRENLTLKGFYKVIQEYYPQQEYQNRLIKRIAHNLIRFHMIKRGSLKKWLLMCFRLRSKKQIKNHMLDGLIILKQIIYEK